jgi:hypothetical protein
LLATDTRISWHRGDLPAPLQEVELLLPSLDTADAKRLDRYE